MSAMPPTSRPAGATSPPGPGRGLAAGRDRTGPHGATGPDEDQVRQALRSVIDPELRADIVELGMVTDLSIDTGGAVTVTVALTVAGCPLRHQITSDIERHVATVRGVRSVTVRTGVMDPAQRSSLMARARAVARDAAPATAVPERARVLAIASGKGGVGKSSVTANLAVALARRGLTVGVLDADIWGFSLPRLLGLDGEIEARSGKMVPLERPVGAGLLRVLSMGFLADEDQAIMWRGLVLNRAVQQFLQDAHWGDLDYLLIDMPPGTGDIQMALSRMLPRTEMIIVTTPAKGASVVASRMGDMAKKGHLRIAGVVENMSGFTCDHGEDYSLFGSGGGQEVADQLGTSLIAKIPFSPSIARLGDMGLTLMEAEMHHQHERQARDAIIQLAHDIVTKIAPNYEAQSCTARMFDAINAALEPR